MRRQIGTNEAGSEHDRVVGSEDGGVAEPSAHPGPIIRLHEWTWGEDDDQWRAETHGQSFSPKKRKKKRDKK